MFVTMQSNSGSNSGRQRLVVSRVSDSDSRAASKQARYESGAMMVCA